MGVARFRPSVWAPLLGVLLLAACAAQQQTVASLPPYPEAPRPAPPSRPGAPPPVPEAPPSRTPASPPVTSARLEPARPEVQVSWRALPGWDQEDHAAALDMIRASCQVASGPAWHEVCLRARDIGAQDEVIARAFLETNFRPVRIEGDDGLLTAYFAPEYEARASREGPFTAAVRPRPTNLPTPDVGASGGAAPWKTRLQIEAAPEHQPLAWMKPEDLFFLQIQGSGVLDFPDGRKLRAVYAANNGQPFVGIATPMRQRGLLAADNTSGEAIRAWLAANRGPDAEAIMRLNPRYIFFTLQPWDGREPNGSAGVTLTPGRSLAVDPTKHDYGALYWIVGEVPSLAGAFPSYRRLAMALDTGGAIKGEVRADLYMGTGDAAGAEAGRVKHRLKMFRLAPVTDPALAAAQ